MSPPLGLYRTLLEDLRPHKPKNYSFLAILTNLRRSSYCAVVLFRLASACASKGKIGKIGVIFFSRLNLALHGCEIMPEAIVGTGLLLPHPNGVTIGYGRIGQDVIVMQNATLGLRSLTDGYSKDPAAYPDIGDNVVISPGAVVLGPVKIGKNADVGANAVVMQDIPEGCLAVGIPARIVEKSKTAPL